MTDAPAWDAFKARVAELGGTVVEDDWLGSGTPHRVICSNGHPNSPRPNNLAMGQGLCGRCATASSAFNLSRVGEAKFRTLVTSLGYQLVGAYVNNRTPIDVLCAEGHLWQPRPDSVLSRGASCRVCARRDPSTAEARFKERVETLGGTVVGQYRGSAVPVPCLCATGHHCNPMPVNLMKADRKLCRICANQDPQVSERNFLKRVAELGGTVIGGYVNSATPVTCRCQVGHTCSPIPNNLQQGEGLCRLCRGKTWDVAYVVVNPDRGRVKFGVSSGSPRARLGIHRRAGYTKVIRVLADLPDAANLERQVKATLRGAGILPVQGREYFDASALALVLDVVDGWTSSTTAA